MDSSSASTSRPKSNGNKGPLFSVIIPSYNRAHVLGRAVESVLAQTCGDFELLVIDDGSSDNTEALCRRYGDRRIRYEKHENNLGQNRALNSGIKSAAGEIICFLDSDDEWLPTMLERVLEKFRSDESIGCVYTSYRIKDTSGNLSGPVGNAIEGCIYKEALALGQISPPSALSVRKECFEAVGTFEPDVVVCQDDIMCLKLAKEFKFGLVNEPLATMHFDAGGRVSGDPLQTARGYSYLYDTFAADILRYCGPGVLAEHLLHSGILFLQAGQRKPAMTAFAKSLRLQFSRRALSYAVFALMPEVAQRQCRNLKKSLLPLF